MENSATPEFPCGKNYEGEILPVGHLLESQGGKTALLCVEEYLSSTKALGGRFGLERRQRGTNQDIGRQVVAKLGLQIYSIAGVTTHPQ
jgi:hypothetical protein